VKFVEPRPFANPDLAARKLVEIAKMASRQCRTVGFISSASTRSFWRLAAVPMSVAPSSGRNGCSVKAKHPYLMSFMSDIGKRGDNGDTVRGNALGWSLKPEKEFRG
jgi:hypothetical protein